MGDRDCCCAKVVERPVSPDGSQGTGLMTQLHCHRGARLMSSVHASRRRSQAQHDHAMKRIYWIIRHFLSFLGLFFATQISVNYGKVLSFAVLVFLRRIIDRSSRLAECKLHVRVRSSF